MDVHFVEEKGILEFGKYLALIKTEWPEEWHEATEGKMLEEMGKSYDPLTDIVKYLECGGEMIGWYRYTKWPRDSADKESAHTLDIAVLGQHQGKGFGAILFEDMIRDCRGRGYRKLMSRTFEKNLRSIALHRKMGFVEAFRKDDSIVWELVL